MSKKELRKILRIVYRSTEHWQKDYTTEYMKGHDDAVLAMADYCDVNRREIIED